MGNVVRPNKINTSPPVSSYVAKDAQVPGDHKIWDTDLDADYTSMQTVLNGGIDTQNISPNANIKGSQLVAQAIAIDRLAVGAGINNFATVDGGLNNAVAQFTITLPTITTRGGLVILGGALGVSAATNGSNEQILIILNRNGSPIMTWAYAFIPPAGPFPLTQPCFAEVAPAGATTYAWQYTGAHGFAQFTSNGGRLFVAELA
jgi:hypothetical protein